MPANRNPSGRVPTSPETKKFQGLKTSIYLEIEGAAHYLPKYAGNLDIMTLAALLTAEFLVGARVN
jgi:acetaldehyde dehydrogenase